MAVEFVGIAEFKTDGGTSILMTAPVGTAVGDLLIAYISKDDNVAIYNTGSYGDWNMLFNNIANGQTCLYIAWKWAEAGDAAETKTEYTWNGDSEDWLGEVICYSGVKAVTPIHGTPGIQTGTSTTPTAPSVAFTNLKAGSLVLQVMGIDQDDNDYVTPAQLAEKFNAIQANDIGGAGGDYSVGSWISPTGFVDSDTFWTDEEYAYDEDTETYYATCTVPTTSWSSYLELTVGAISCSKVRFWAYYAAIGVNQISLDVYYNGAWHNIYEGAYTSEAWVEKEIGSIKTITAMRAKFYNAFSGSQPVRFYEADFLNPTTVPTGETGTAIFTATSRPWAAATLVIEAAAAADQFEYSGSGSLTYSGIATQTHSRNYLTTASGSLAFSGGAVWSRDYLTVGSGTLAFSGSAVIIIGLAYVGSGSLAYSGEAVQSYTRDFISTAVGELIYSGEAIFSYLCDFLFTGSGELAYSGVAEQSYTYNFSYVASGQFIYSGSALYTRDYIYVGSGSLAFSGSALLTVGFTYISSGALTYSGSATQTHTTDFVYTASGSLVFSGAADCIYEEAGADFIYTGTGSFNYSGVGIYSLGIAYIGTGTLAYSGEAVQSHTTDFLYDTSGNFIFSGAGICSIGFASIGSGSFTYSGEAIQTYTFNYLCVGMGEFIYSGSAIQTHTHYYPYEGSGDFTYSGNAITTIGFACISSGEFIYSGSAICYYELSEWEYIGSGIFIWLGSTIYSYTKVKWVKIAKETGDWIKVIKEEEDWILVSKEKDDFTKVTKEKDDWTKVNKEKGDWDKINKEMM